MPLRARDDGGGHQVPGRVVERLHRQGRRAVLSKTAHPLVGNAGAHLHEAVEPAPAAPWSRPAVGVERDIDQPRPCLPPRFRAEPQAGERVRAVAVHQHVRPAKQAKKLDANGATRFASRQAYQLPYASQRETPRDRALSRAWKARSRINGSAASATPVSKPKWMRRKTFDRLMERVEAAEKGRSPHGSDRREPLPKHA